MIEKIVTVIECDNRQRFLLTNIAIVFSEDFVVFFPYREELDQPLYIRWMIFHPVERVLVGYRIGSIVFCEHRLQDALQLLH